PFPCLGRYAGTWHPQVQAAKSRVQTGQLRVQTGRVAHANRPVAHATGRVAHANRRVAHANRPVANENRPVANENRPVANENRPGARANLRSATSWPGDSGGANLQRMNAFCRTGSWSSQPRGYKCDHARAVRGSFAVPCSGDYRSGGIHPGITPSAARATLRSLPWLSDVVSTFSDSSSERGLGDGTFLEAQACPRLLQPKAGSAVLLAKVSRTKWQFLFGKKVLEGASIIRRKRAARAQARIPVLDFRPPRGGCAPPAPRRLRRRRGRAGSPSLARSSACAWSCCARRWRRSG